MLWGPIVKISGVCSTILARTPSCRPLQPVNESSSFNHLPPSFHPYVTTHVAICVAHSECYGDSPYSENPIGGRFGLVTNIGFSNRFMSTLRARGVCSRGCYGGNPTSGNELRFLFIDHFPMSTFVRANTADVPV